MGFRENHTTIILLIKDGNKMTPSDIITITIDQCIILLSVDGN